MLNILILWRRAIRIRGATTRPSCPLFTELPAFLSAPALCLLLVGRRRLGLASSINIRSSLNKAQSYPNCRAVSFRAASLHTGDPAHSSRSFFSQPSASQQPPPPFAEGGLSCCCTSASSHMGISCSSLKTAHHHLWLGWQPTICLCQDNTIHKRT